MMDRQARKATRKYHDKMESDFRCAPISITIRDFQSYNFRLACLFLLDRIDHDVFRCKVKPLCWFINWAIDNW